MISETLGTSVGKALAPAIALGARLRRSRLLHPRGIVFAANVEAISTSFTEVAALRLCGPALLRMSTALWKNEREWPDVLGCAIRFRSDAQVSPAPDAGDQDILFATIRSPLTMPFGPLGTNAHDFFDNTYFATAPFDVEDVGRVKLRLVPEQVDEETSIPRRRKILRSVAQGKATLRLELRRTFHFGWLPVVRITLTEQVLIDQDALRFWPFQNGRGIKPRGFVHALRHGAYASSQATGHP